MENHPSQIRSAAKAFDIEREELGGFVDDVAKELGAIGAFWGQGKEGVTFFKGQGGGTGYEAVTGQITEAIEMILDAHEEIPRRLRLMADNVQVTDWANVALVLSALPRAEPGQRIWGQP
ncbi:hypothetical protein [Nonomuraea cavernae]|uniref:hypothetical protein n=1 Tax=Nonomuraea cavernae TaxID=2045107 RepID=UPI0033FE7FF1